MNNIPRGWALRSAMTNTEDLNVAGRAGGVQHLLTRVPQEVEMVFQTNGGHPSTNDTRTVFWKSCEVVPRAHRSTHHGPSQATSSSRAYMKNQNTITLKLTSHFRGTPDRDFNTAFVLYIGHTNVLTFDMFILCNAASSSFSTHADAISPIPT